MGEVHTGLLHHSSAVSTATATRLLDLVLGERVRRSERPVAHVVSPPRYTGVDCVLPVDTGAKVRGVGSVVSRASLTGGHVLQGSTHLRVAASGATRRLAWSHYLSRPGVVEAIGKLDGPLVADAFLAGASVPGQLDLGSPCTRIMDTVQHASDVDHRTAFRTSRTRLRWVVLPADVASGPAVGEERRVTFATLSESVRTLRLIDSGEDLSAQVELCEDLALHDWLLTTLLSLVERSRIGTGDRSAVVARLRPAVDYLLHLWMPAARVDQSLMWIWDGIEQRPGFSRQWRVNVDRVRDQLALATVDQLGANAPGG